MQNIKIGSEMCCFLATVVRNFRLGDWVTSAIRRTIEQMLNYALISLIMQKPTPEDIFVIRVRLVFGLHRISQLTVITSLSRASSLAFHAFRSTLPNYTTLHFSPDPSMIFVMKTQTFLHCWPAVHVSSESSLRHWPRFPIPTSISISASFETW
jgi:hypothetical protein